MLKERINFLIQQKGMTRKTLVNGLVTLPHFSNILAGRYLLADDIAKQLGKRLGVTTDYILRTEDSSLEINNQADKFFRQVVLFQQMNDAYVASVPEKNDALVIELSTALMKACYFQATNNRVSYQALHETYLNFYLENFDDSSILTLPLPLRKAFFYYKLQFYRSISKLEESVSYIERLLPMLEEDAEIWIAVKKIEMEVLVVLRLFDKAKKSFEDTLHRVQTENLSHHLSSLYIAESAYCFYLKLYEEAFVNLAKAEEYLVYMNDSAGSYLVTIFNNRILMLIATNQLVSAVQEVERLEKYLRQQKNIDATFWTLIELHKADIALAGGSVTTLEEILARLQKANKTSDQDYAVIFYQSQLALLQGNFKEAVVIAEECLPFFEQANITNRLLMIYETIAICAEQTRQYKKSSDMYKKMTQLLKMN
ncbi:XRE family transcriptional regulator [Listeria ivanovii]|uniref:Putative transcriptional regulator n=1 Tax=Listeria ivanovii (strain ATCC BAA-678 / PAM 55) TaxID=881621 RepID=G2ZEI3_LISIP|nr:transcriptional regulator [Listeria ivanovii]AHI55559.1 hypothetical protein AX25_05430 [Listeria ivanovii WSLC3009]AIS65014.1 hypothetical protein JL52_05350 [Listeria ivanovii subsp. ivanovii]MBC1758270.1 XRE family transcriptional regulator [Listeria ivanovii]MBK3913147.1 XRE family transcriptional regulator [Listeria ivanovii subsp. ivanovii]MBK3920736.1 XRE family transcriptional regulator [Listeria ivanovii subsp. ivanovii]